MCPTEWWRIYEVKRPKNLETDYAGTLTQNTVEELYELLGD